MAAVTMKAAILLKHLSSVSDAVKDLRIDVADNLSFLEAGGVPTLSYSFAAMTHYLEVTEEIPDAHVTSGGSLLFSDIPKSIAFLKKCKGDVTVKQLMTNRLSFASGGKKMTVPCFEVNSSKLVGKYENLIKACEASGGTQFATATLSLSAQFNMKEIKDIASMGKLIPKDADYKVRANGDEGELMVKVAKGGNVSLFATTSLNDVDITSEEGTIESSFGYWLLPCLSMLGDGNTKMYMGNGTPIILNQGVHENYDGGSSRTLVIIDQEE